MTNKLQTIREALEQFADTSYENQMEGDCSQALKAISILDKLQNHIVKPTEKVDLEKLADELFTYISQYLDHWMFHSDENQEVLQNEIILKTAIITTLREAAGHE